VKTKTQKKGRSKAKARKRHKEQVRRNEMFREANKANHQKEGKVETKANSQEGQ
jgi:hypothetical protein